MTQTVDVPTSNFATRYAAWKPAPQGRYQAKSLDRAAIFMFSLPKTGKSTLIESNENCLRIDLDRAGNSNPNPKCVTIPSLTDDDGKSIVITKKFIDDLMACLVSEAKAGNPRPKTICFDTVDQLVSVLCQALCVERGVKHFSDLEAKTWGIVYEQVRDYCNTLTANGYGYILTSHIVNKKIEIGDQAAMQLDLTIKDTLYSSIKGALDLIVALDRGQETIQTPIPMLGVDGKPIMLNGKPKIAKVESKHTPYVDLVFHQAKPEDPFAPNYSRLVHGRIGGLPERIRLPRKDGWPMVRDIYNAAAIADGATLI